MVAEPVSATLSFLQNSYENVSGVISALLLRVFDSLSGWVPPGVIWSSQPPITASTGVKSGYEHWNKWLRSCRYEFVVLGGGIGLGALVYYHRAKWGNTALNRVKQRRRVPKLANGARKEVVLVVGSPTEPFTRLLALDFEKRGFIVYLTILDEKDARYTQSNPITDDINYLSLDGSADLALLIGKFRQLLRVPVEPIKGAEQHFLHLAAVVFAPNLYFPMGPLENISPSAWERDMSRTKLYTLLFSAGFLQLVREQRSKVIAIIPNIASTLGLAYHGPEVVFQNSMKDLFSVLSKEVALHGVSMSQIRLGNLHLSALSPKSRVPAMVEAEIRSWSTDLQELYGKQFQRQQTKTLRPQCRLAGLILLAGLHHLLFDMIFQNHPSGVVYYGLGSRAYERLAAMIPAAFLQIFL